MLSFTDRYYDTFCESPNFFTTLGAGDYQVPLTVPYFSPEVDLACVNTVRALSMDAVQAANSGHPGLPLGAAAMAHALWSRFLRFSPRNPGWWNRDRFVLSAGHGSMLLYSLLHLSGYELSLDDLKQFRQWGSKTPGHPENHLTPGVEMATGPLGQGLSTAVGMALAERHLAARFNRPDFQIFDHYTYVICSDGDLMEGITNEAASLAGHQGLGKLIALYDDNGITIDGSTSIAFTENVQKRFEALGWQTISCDGMSVEAVVLAIESARMDTERPTLISCKTTIGYGSPNKAGSSKSHGAPLGADEVQLTKEKLGIPVEPAFWKADEAVDVYGKIGRQGEKLEADWDSMWARYVEAYPEESAMVKAGFGFGSTNVWADLPTFSEKIATRKAGEETMQCLYDSVPTLVGGSADLAESNFTHFKASAYMQGNWPQGRNIAFGIREHAMAAATNGINLHGGLRGFCSTFLIFSDYCRPSIRLAALMHCPTIFVFTHDSIGVGEDGPTHQPIEHLMSLRAIPNLNVFRPCDGNETAACWALALEQTNAPSVLALSRQALSALTPASDKNHPACMGGYVLSPSEKGEAQITLIATGSEVSVAMGAKAILESEAISVSVVSMPCWELFDQQSESYRSEVLPPGSLKISVEAGTTLGWQKFADVTVGIDHFGASAPGDVLMKEFGFTAENVALVAKSHLKQTQFA